MPSVGTKALRSFFLHVCGAFLVSGVAIDVVENFTDGSSLVAILVRHHPVGAIVPDQRASDLGDWRVEEKLEVFFGIQENSAFVPARGIRPKVIEDSVDHFLDHPVSFDDRFGV